MKYLFLSILLGTSTLSYSQDTVQISSDELEEFFTALDTLRFQDSLKTELIKELNFQIKLGKEVAQYDSLIISYKDEEISLLNHQVNLRWSQKFLPYTGFLDTFLPKFCNY